MQYQNITSLPMLAAALIIIVDCRGTANRTIVSTDSLLRVVLRGGYRESSSFSSSEQ